MEVCADANSLLSFHNLQMGQLKYSAGNVLESIIAPNGNIVIVQKYGVTLYNSLGEIIIPRIDKGKILSHCLIGRELWYLERCCFLDKSIAILDIVFGAITTRRAPYPSKQLLVSYINGVLWIFTIGKTRICRYRGSLNSKFDDFEPTKFITKTVTQIPNGWL